MLDSNPGSGRLAPVRVAGGGSRHRSPSGASSPSTTRHSSDENDYGDRWRVRAARGPPDPQLVPLFDQYEVDLVWNGHILPTTWPVRRAPRRRGGTTYLVTGGGGGGLGPGARAPSVQNVRHGHCYRMVAVNGHTLEFKAFGLDGGSSTSRGSRSATAEARLLVGSPWRPRTRWIAAAAPSCGGGLVRRASGRAASSPRGRPEPKSIPSALLSLAALLLSACGGGSGLAGDDAGPGATAPGQP